MEEESTLDKGKNVLSREEIAFNKIKWFPVSYKKSRIKGALGLSGKPGEKIYCSIKTLTKEVCKDYADPDNLSWEQERDLYNEIEQQAKRILPNFEKYYSKWFVYNHWRGTYKIHVSDKIKPLESRPRIPTPEPANYQGGSDYYASASSDRN